MGASKIRWEIIPDKIFRFLLLSFLLTYSFQANSQKSTDEDSIINFTQKLIDGIATGDTMSWSKYLDDSCIVTSEDGSVKTKQQFISSIGVPPNYIKVKETISSPLFRINSNTIVFIYNANLSLNIYGQQRLNEICQTDTWFKTRDGWKLISSEALDKFEIPLSQTLNPNIINMLSGEYKLSNEYDYKIFMRDRKLFIQLYGKKENELKCETDYSYYIETRLLTRYIFVHDENNKINKLILRRAGRDIVIPKTN